MSDPLLISHVELMYATPNKKRFEAPAEYYFRATIKADDWSPVEIKMAFPELNNVWDYLKTVEDRMITMQEYIERLEEELEAVTDGN